MQQGRVLSNWVVLHTSIINDGIFLEDVWAYMSIAETNILKNQVHALHLQRQEAGRLEKNVTRKAAHGQD